MAKVNPKVSVIIPTCNRPEFLHRCLLSVEVQTFREFEVVVVDDSSDQHHRNQEIIQCFRGSMDLFYHRNDVTRGAPFSRNRGISFSRGGFLAFLDDDDEWLPMKLESQIALYERSTNDLGITYTWADTVDDLGRSLVHHREKYSGKDLSSLLDRCFIRSATVMVRREAVECAGGFDEEMESCQDWDLWVRILEAGFSYDFVPEVLARVHAHSGIRVGNSPHALSGYSRFFQKHRDSYINRGMAKNLSEKYRWLGWIFISRGQVTAGRRLIIGALGLWKQNIRAWIRLVQSLLFWGKKRGKAH